MIPQAQRGEGEPLPVCRTCGKPIPYDGKSGHRAWLLRKFCSHRCSATGAKRIAADTIAAKAGRMSSVATREPAPIVLPRLSFLEHRFDWESRDE